MVNQALVKMPEDEHILLIGLDHVAHRWTAESEGGVLMKALRERKMPIAILIEYTVEYFSKKVEFISQGLNGQEFQDDPFMDKFIELWVNLTPEDKEKLHVVPAADRPREHDELDLIEQHLSRVKSKLMDKKVHERADQAKLIETALKQSTQEICFPFCVKVAEFFGDLDKKLHIIRAFKAKYDKIQTALDPYIWRYQEEVERIKKSLDPSFNSSDLLCGAVLVSCLRCKTISELDEKIKLLNICRFHTYGLLCDLNFLNHIMRLKNNYKNLVAVTGAGHVQRMVSIFKSLNHKLVSSVPMDKFETITCNPCDGMLGMVLYLVHSMEHLPEQQTMPSNQSSSSNSQPSQSAALSSAKCQVCDLTENLKLCGRCQKVLYCGEACQRKDWKMHKVNCQAS